MTKISKHFLEDTGAIIAGIGITAVAAAALFFTARHFGYFSYIGLSADDVASVMAEVDSRFKILSRVHGRTWNSDFYRGIYSGGDTAYPLYYRYEIFDDGNASLEIYPLVYEKWSTNQDIFGTTGDLTFPIQTVP